MATCLMNCPVCGVERVCPGSRPAQLCVQTLRRLQCIPTFTYHLPQHEKPRLPFEFFKFFLET